MKGLILVDESEGTNIFHHIFSFLLKTSIFNKVLKSLRQEIINFSLKYTLYFIYNYLLKQEISMVTTPLLLVSLLLCNSKEEYGSAIFIHYE